MPEMYPVFLKLDGRPVLVVGAGKIGWRKVEGLLASGAVVTVVSPQVCRELRELRQQFTLIEREWQPSDCDGSLLVVAATGDSVLNARIRKCAQKAGALVNWDWLLEQPVAEETGFLRHLRLERPLAVYLDGRHGRGVVLEP